jgi:RNA polymerase sigma-70 factor (ECF subfamily)
MTISEAPEAEIYERTRPLLLAIAYRMLGSVSEAEDVVQEAFVRYHTAAARGEAVGSPKAYLATVTTRISIDQLRSARVRRERYVGQWLPEPLLTGLHGRPAAWNALLGDRAKSGWSTGLDGGSEVERYAELNESLSMAFLVVLERLSPVERAVFVLREVFEYTHAEIARIVGGSEANIRQIAVRARRHIDEGRPRFELDRSGHAQLAGRFFAALRDADVDGLLSTLAVDVTVIGDGGGLAPAAAQPVSGRERVVRLLLGLARLAARLGLELQEAEVNGGPGALAVDREGRLTSVLALDIAGGSVRAVRSVANPDKLRHLGPVVNAGDLLKAVGDQPEAPS